MKRLIYPESRPVEKLLVSEQCGRISYDAVQALNYREAQIGEQFGPLWATYWFRGEARIPESWRGSRVDLLWESNSEATLWIDGRIAQGLNHEPQNLSGRVAPDGRRDAVLVQSARGGDVIRFEVEMACNRMFGEGYLQSPEHLVRSFALERCDIARF